MSVIDLRAELQGVTRHPLDEVCPTDSVGKAGCVMRRWNPQRAALPIMDDQHFSPIAGEIERRRKAGGTRADNDGLIAI